jgi:hypothetical protein
MFERVQLSYTGVKESLQGAAGEGGLPVQKW